MQSINPSKRELTSHLGSLFNIFIVLLLLIPQKGAKPLFYTTYFGLLHEGHGPGKDFITFREFSVFETELEKQICS